MHLYLILTGILAAVSMASPDLIVIGYFLFFLPGFLMAYSPTLFVYPLIATVWSKLLEAYTKHHVIVAVSLLLACAFAIPYIENFVQRKDIEKMVSSDVSGETIKELPDIIALLETPARNGMQEKSSLCGGLCQRLLYNGAVKRVLVGKPVDLDRGVVPKIELTAYFIEKREDCPAADIPEASSDLYIIGRVRRPESPEDAVRLRISAGECLLREKMPLSSTGMIVSYERKEAFHPEKIGFEKFIVANIISGKTSLIKKSTHAWTHVLQKPLVYGASGSSGGTPNLHFHFLKELVETGSPIKKDKEYVATFGDAIDWPSIPTNLNLYGVFSAELESSRTEIFLFKPYINSLIRSKHVSESDIDLIVKALNDSRVADLSSISQLVRYLKEQADPLAVPLMSRFQAVFFTGNNKAIRDVVDGIEALSDAGFLRVSDELEMLLKNHKHRSIRGNLLYRIDRLKDEGKE